MSSSFKLLEKNPNLGLKNGIYQDTSERFRDSTLSNYIQVAVTEVFSTVDDKSMFSLDVESALTTDELRKALSTTRYSFLRTFELTGINHVLDLSEDFGGVAHFLADNVGSVESVKIDPDLARISTARCANKHNVCHISEDLEKLSFPSGHYDLIIIAQLEALNLSKAQEANLYKRLNSALTAKGVLVINTLNSKRMKQWLDTGSSNLNKDLAYYDLYQAKHNNELVIEHSRKALRDTLLDTNYSAIDFHANFSNNNDCRTLFSEDYLTSSVDALNHFYRLGSIQNENLNEFLLYKKLWSDKERIVDFANRFLVIAGASTKNIRQLYDNDFSYFPGTGRKPCWRTITSRKRTAQNVEKTLVNQDTISDANQSLVTQNLEAQPFHKGRILIDDWLQALLDQDNRGFEDLVEEYNDWLQAESKNKEFTKTAYDLLPFNLILNERGDQRSFLTIDTEWQINREFTPEFVLFRALFWFAFENKTLLKSFAEKNDLFSIGMFVSHYMPSVHQVVELEAFVALEEEIQSHIDSQFRENSVRNVLNQNFDPTNDEISDDVLSCITAWGDESGSIDEKNVSSGQWNKAEKVQKLEIRLPEFSNSSPFLRIDPMACRGSFKIEELTILDQSGQVILNLDSAKNIDKECKLSGLHLNGKTFLSLNEDPFLTLDLRNIKGAQKPSTLHLSLKWKWGKGYSSALNNLSSAVSLQNASITGQSHRLNQFRADIEYKAQRIDDLVGHRTDLAQMLKEQELENKHLRQRLQHQIDTLEARLHTQTVRNDELHGYLLMRPTTRVKRVAARTIGRITGKPAIEDDAEPIEVENVEQSPLPTGELLGQNTEDYGQWVSENSLSENDIARVKADIETMAYKPTFSILVPIYNTDPEYLLPMIQSVQNQIYPHWQLCLVDDCSPKSYLKQILEHEALNDDRISIQLNDVNQGISVTTNDALAMAKGDYIALLDHDDEISIDALYENAKVINQSPDVGLIYSDEDKMDMQGNRLEPYFKPDYSPDLLDTNNYVCHFTVIKKSIADEIGGFREGLDGSQDHDIILRAANSAEKIVHIPKILYHWRKIPGSTAVVYDAKSYAWEAGRKAVEDMLAKKENGVKVEFGTLKGTYRVFREIQGEPLVSIIIPFKDKPELLDSCLNSIINRSSYSNIEIVGVSNNSKEEATFSRMKHFSEQDERIRFVEKNVPFNFSEICNYGVEQANGEYVILLNNDIEIISPDWIERMLEHAQREHIGAVGGKLLYPNGTIQHAGVVAGMVGAAGHPHKFFPDNHIGYHGRLHMVYNVSAVTGAMMMMKTDKFKQVGGFDAENLAVAYNDIDLCLKLLDAGYINLFTPHAKATHHESISRGYEDTEKKVQRLLKEQRFFKNKWADFLAKGDPYYNPNLSLKNERFSLNFKD